MGERVICIVQARQGSSRLPGKSLRPLQGRPLIAHVLERAQAIPGSDGLVLATTGRDEDDGLAALATDLGVAVVRGSEQDVLDRMFVAATLARAEVVIRVTGDCPFMDPAVAGDVLALYRHSFALYAWNDTARSGYPDGTDVEVFSYNLLRHAHEHARHLRDREHVTSWIRDNYEAVTLRLRDDLSWLKLSVDTMADYRRACAVAAQLRPGDYSMAGSVAAYRRMMTNDNAAHGR
jgi:spore coat polysaccharide biosynthesis protein SpsF (cytidylyltransferase family)